MDTLTHIVLGACIGELAAGKKIGKKALLLGALAQNIPDADFVASWWLPTAGDVLAHRGFTHSFLFAALCAPLIAWLSLKVYRRPSPTFRQWLLFWGVQILIHDFIDAFNAYGTGWFVPFSPYRVSFNSMFVADPLFIIWPAAATIALLFMGKSYPGRSRWASMGLAASTAYLFIGLLFKTNISSAAQTELNRQQITTTDFFTTPTPLNNLLWYIVAANDSGYFIGYHSVLDRTPAIKFHYVPRNDSLIRPYEHRQDIRDLLQFSKGYYAIQARHDTLLFNVLRFEEIAGWPEPGPGFVFHYDVLHPGGNEMVVQRGRFAGWDGSVLRAFWQRMLGR